MTRTNITIVLTEDIGGTVIARTVGAPKQFEYRGESTMDALSGIHSLLVEAPVYHLQVGEEFIGVQIATYGGEE